MMLLRYCDASKIVRSATSASAEKSSKTKPSLRSTSAKSGRRPAQRLSVASMSMRIARWSTTISTTVSPSRSTIACPETCPPASTGSRSTLCPGRAAAEAPAAASFGDEKWPEVFQDLQLQKLIRTALEQNYDVRIAATRILQAQAQLSITRSDEFPSAAAIASANSTRNAASKFFTAFNTSDTELGLGFQWNLDFWGKYRRATEAARDQLLANNWARQEVNISVIADVASAYFTLREQDLQIQISRQTLASDQ